MWYPPNMPSVIQTIREAIESSGESRYSISDRSGVSQAQLSRFVRGEAGMSVDNLERLADALGLEIIVRPKRRRGRSK